jgi:caa(3)-type oxidase subunit IV
MAHKIVHWRYYLINAAILCFLMALTVIVAKMPFFHLSDNPNGLNLFIAVFIAVLKAGCIVAIFMGAYWSTRLVKLFALMGFIWLPIFFLFTFTDYGFANPLKEFGTPYYDVNSPGTNPEPGGQNFGTHGRESAPSSGGNYVPPPHLLHPEAHEAAPAGAGTHESAAEAAGAAPATSEHH